MRPPKQAGASCVHRVIVDIFDRLSRNDDDIPSRPNCICSQPHNLTKLSFDAISYDCIANTCAHSKSKAAVGQIVLKKAQYKMPVAERFPLLANLLKSLICPNPEFLFHVKLLLMK